MGATNEKDLNKNPAIIEIVQDPGTITEILADGSNAEAVKTEIDALTFIRLASITDLAVSDDYSDILKVETDDNGVIYSSANEVVNITGNWYEAGDSDAIAEMTNKYVVATVTPVGEIVGSKIGATEMPSLIIRITSDLGNSKVKQVYLKDSNFTGQLINGFVDVNRAGDLPNSPFEFASNKWGDIFTFTDDV